MEEKPDLIEVPFETLEAETLTAVIEAFVLREGTNYGAQDVALQTQIEQVKAQLRNRSAKLVFDPESETTSVITAKQFRDRLLEASKTRSPT